MLVSIVLASDEFSGNEESVSMEFDMRCLTRRFWGRGRDAGLVVGVRVIGWRVGFGCGGNVAFGSCADDALAIVGANEFVKSVLAIKVSMISSSDILVILIPIVLPNFISLYL